MSTSTESYDHRTLEARWQRIWDERGDYSVDLARAEKPYYNLMMFPYPSAEGLHVGNCFAFTGSDIHGRHMRLQGHDVFEPMGFDAFGIHSENFAFKVGKHPKELTRTNVENFRENQLKRLGAMFDWSHEVDTTDPDYYRWTQWILLKLHENGLLYRGKAPVNWCPGLCQCVLADSQVEDGLWERIQAADGARLERDRPQHLLGAWLQENGIPFLDLLDDLRAVSPDEEGRRHLYHLRDTHFNARGNLVAGQALARFCDSLIGN